MQRVLTVFLVVMLAGVTLGSAGCLLQGQGRAEALADAVHGMVDETRWGRAELAADRVAPAFRERFVQAHAKWGQSIEIADVDLGTLRMASDEESATAVLTVSWYALDTMDLATTQIRQRWEHKGGNYVLAREAVIGGDARLLERAAPAAPQPATPRAGTPRTEASRTPNDG